MKDKNVVLGVTGGIASYKSADLVSRLRKIGVNVKVIMTSSAQEFVRPLTFESLSQNPVSIDMFDSQKTFETEHISWAKWADLFVVAPATANILGKVANGIADDMLSTTIMATEAPVVFALAMNTVMYNSIAVRDNVEILKKRGYYIIDSDSGRLACGDIGKGKMAQPEDIVSYIEKLMSKSQDYLGKKILVTAGPTIEPIDPVRYITNHSSGKMGYAIAEAAYKRGALVTLISGPTNIMPPKVSEIVNVSTNEEMLNAVLDRFDDTDIVIKAAAVSDFKVNYSPSKIKKKDSFTLELTKNNDILLELGKRKTNQILVGFAAESNDLIENAKSKLQKKNLDLIVANDITKEGSGFDSSYNSVVMINDKGVCKDSGLKLKSDIGDMILDEVAKLWDK